jgi:flagellar basal body-associated protein FliL
MTNFEWFLLIVVVIVVPLIVAVVVTLWTIDQANKRKRANRADPQIGVKRKAALSPEEVAERKAERQKRLDEEAAQSSSLSPALPDDVSRETSPLTNDSRSG